jgi:hypothetical protein
VSQLELARLPGIKREYLSMIEQGRANSGPVTRARIEPALAQMEH